MRTTNLCSPHLMGRIPKHPIEGCPLCTIGSRQEIEHGEAMDRADFARKVAKAEREVTP